MIFNSKEYWENRYKSGGNSGAGSYNTLALYKAEIINNFIIDNSINSLIEYGCGDGNNLSLINCNTITGIDVSPKAIEICKLKMPQHTFELDTTIFASELVTSLDVIYHLIEDDVYDEYMTNMCRLSKKWIIIYSANEDNDNYSPHVKSRKFSNHEYLNNNFELVEIIKNKYPVEEFGPENGSFSDWYIYKKK